MPERAFSAIPHTCTAWNWGAALVAGPEEMQAALAWCGGWFGPDGRAVVPSPTGDYVLDQDGVIVKIGDLFRVMPPADFYDLYE